MHHDRLADFLDFLQEPYTVAELSHQYFGEVQGYNVLLALEEVGAHLEYLYQYGQLEIVNRDELENSPHPVPIRYRTIKV